MSKLFMYGTPLEGIEQLMVMVPNFQPRRSGIVINNYFNCRRGVKDCNCNVINGSKDLDKCGYIGSDFEANVDKKRYKDLVMECFKYIILGMKIPKIKEQKTMKLYMPLTITTYNIENDYGYRESLNEPLELGNYEIINYIDEIHEAIERDTLPEEKDRGLMHYYDEHDSVIAKVVKYEFSVEMVDDELMGVAILTLNDDLTMN